jgi:homoserine dehydrogenase
MGLDISLGAVNIENIVPHELKDIELSLFIQALSKYDDHFIKKNDVACKNHSVLRYVGIIEMNGDARVSLAEYPKSHPFASLNGSDNIIAITTKNFPNSLIIQGAGAGAAVTSFGLMSDIFKIIRHLFGPIKS